MPIVIEEMNIEISVQQQAANTADGSRENSALIRQPKKLVQEVLDAVFEVLHHQNER